jgi:hypothetical protein
MPFFGDCVEAAFSTCPCRTASQAAVPIAFAHQSDAISGTTAASRD